MVFSSGEMFKYSLCIKRKMDYRSVASQFAAGAMMAYSSLALPQGAIPKPHIESNPDQHIIRAKTVADGVRKTWLSSYSHSDLEKKQEGRRTLMREVLSNPTNPYLSYDMAFMHLADGEHCKAQTKLDETYQHLLRMRPNLVDWPDRLPEHMQVVRRMADFGVRVYKQTCK
jgi:hypothetical protein